MIYYYHYILILWKGCMMKTLLATLFLLSNLMAITAKDAAWVLDAQTDMNKAYDIAKTKKKKLILLVVIRDGCNWCEMMVHETLRNKNVKSHLADMVVVIADFDSSTAKQFNTTLTPSVYFIDPKTKKRIDEHIGYEQPGSFIMDIISAEEKAD